MTRVSKPFQALLCGAALFGLPASALAQSTATKNVTVDNTVSADPNAAAAADNTVTTTQTTQEDHKQFPWGLLGLLGLGGLLGLKRREDAPDINVDARRNARK